MSERKGTKGLELWCKRLVKDCPEVQIDNMTTSWRNGMAFCALVHHFRPDLIDMTKLKPENIYENNQLAFNIAEKHLGIPALLDPEDMVENDVPDRLSILTYLSQFYQRLSHTVNTKVSESEPNVKLSQTTRTMEPPTPIRFGKTGLDKCTACGLPVYLAQRLIVSHKLYHRRCFRCSKCSGHLNPKSFDVIEGCDFSCDSCENEKSLSKYLNNNDCEQIGMLAFNDDLHESKDVSQEEPIKTKQKSRPQSILDKISMFEKLERDTSLDTKIPNISIKDNLNTSSKEVTNTSGMEIDVDLKHITSTSTDYETPFKNAPEIIYKSNIDKFNFLQTQLSDHTLDEKVSDDTEVTNVQHKDECLNDTDKILNNKEKHSDEPITTLKEDSNITDDSRIAKCHSISSNLDNPSLENLNQIVQEIKITVPPRRKKQNASERIFPVVEKPKPNIIVDNKYPDHLNPFSDDDNDDVMTEDKKKDSPKKVSTNPFGSSDEEDNMPPAHPPPKVPANATSPVKRLIAVNPFWSDGEEPSSDEEFDDRSCQLYKSSMATSTPNLQGGAGRRVKPPAPAPPPAAAPAPAAAPRLTLAVTAHLDQPCTSMDDLASVSSLSSFNSTLNSDHRDRSTPLMKKKRPAPTPPDSLSTVSGHGESLEQGIDTSGLRSGNSTLGGRKTKGPAPGLPLPERREVKLQMSPEELQVQLDLLETQQLGLERQGVLIEKMIRDKCEGDEASSVPQEEVEDLVIQLCELVNEKNDLFRKQTELMYIRRQQRLEQEQADIEHEIRIIQSRPAVNRIDSDKVREEQLVSRLVEIVRMRDELVQQIEAERRRERQEDLAIAASIASKRAQRNNSESNSSSMKSVEVPTPKKNKVKDKVKKQLKKAKNTLISKKKDDSTDHKEEKMDKEKKSK